MVQPWNIHVHLHVCWVPWLVQLLWWFVEFLYLLIKFPVVWPALFSVVSTASCLLVKFPRSPVVQFHLLLVRFQFSLSPRFPLYMCWLCVIYCNLIIHHCIQQYPILYYIPFVSPLLLEYSILLSLSPMIFPSHSQSKDVPIIFPVQRCSHHIPCPMIFQYCLVRWNHGILWLSIQLGRIPTPLTNSSYFSRWLLHHQPGFLSLSHDISQVRTVGDAAHGVAGSSWGPPNAAMKKSCVFIYTMSLIYINNTDS